MGLFIMDIGVTKGEKDLPRVEYIEGNEQLLDEVHILWEELIQDHRVKSKHFTSRYDNRNFDDRKAGLIEKTKTVALRIDLVKDSDTGRGVGYCICSVSHEKIGEVDSIYIVPEHRALGIGDSLMRRALNWMDRHYTEKKVISIAGGNEQVFSFYGRYGFYPKNTILEQASLC